MNRNTVLLHKIRKTWRWALADHFSKGTNKCCAGNSLRISRQDLAQLTSAVFVFLDDYILERREAVAALLTFRHFIEHPNEHGDGGPSPEDKAEEVKPITGRFVGKEEEIALHPDGIPEQCGKKWVEKLFTDWLKNGWSYDQAYVKFKEQYPRVTSGRPGDEWIKKPPPKDGCCCGC